MKSRNTNKKSSSYRCDNYFNDNKVLLSKNRSLSQVNDTLQRVRQSGSDKEKEFLQKVRIAREEEWAKISKTESEKADVRRLVD